MAKWPLPTWQRGAVLIRQFAGLSLVVISVITVGLCLAISYSLRQGLLEREWQTTADFIRTETVQNLAPSDFAAPDGEAAQARFRRFYEQTVIMPEIVRVKVYDGAKTVIWSDEPRLIGRRFPDNPQLSQALAGQTTVNLEIGEKKGENLYEGAGQRLVEVYVPIVFPGNSNVVGVVETYKEPTLVFVNIRKSQLTVVGAAVAGGVLLYVSLFWVVRRASGRLESQHQTLEQRSQELSAANQELRAVQAQLLEAERLAAIGEVVAAVAHGIRNPLANIRASAQVAALDCNHCGSTTAPKSVANIISEVDRLEGRLKELLQFVRPAERQSQSLDLNTVLREALRTVEARLARARIRVEERLAPALPVITGDRLLLEQVFVNLLGNAIEAVGGGGGVITIVSGPMPRSEGSAEVFAEVRDNGPGIAPEERPRIFTLFYTTKAQGTGLGLTIAKKFVEAHGGTIELSSQLHEGATFRVTLPIRPKA